MTHKMYGCQCMINNTEGNNDHICIRNNLFNCRQPHQHIHLKQNKKQTKKTSINN